MPAFEGAVQLGYRYVETDAHVTADGVVVAFHDDRLDRVTDRTGVVGELPWAEVAAARVDGREPIALLADLLTTWPQLRVNIDPKHDAVVEPLAEVIRATGATDRVCIGAFSGKRIARLRALLGPTLCTSLGPGGVARLRAAATAVPGAGRIAGALEAPCAQVPVRQGPVPIVDRRFVDTAHRLGLAVHVWTIDDAPQMDALLDLGVDGIMTDQPATLKQVLQQRGQWFP